MSDQADQLREAFASRQLDRLIGMMDAGVTWRGLDRPGHPVPHCHDRAAVREVMARALARGVNGSPIIVAEAGDSVVIDPRATGALQDNLHQVMTFRGGRIVLMQDYADLASALAAIGG